MVVNHYLCVVGWTVGACFGTTPGGAQTLHVDEGQQLHISENTTFTIVGGMHNQGVMTNLGQVYISGDWINRQTYRAEAGSEVILTGELPQQIDQRGQSLGHLTIDGGGPKRLLSEARVSDTLTLVDGIVLTQGTAPITLGPAAEVEGGSENAYVEGPVRYQGNGVRRFPLGQDGRYLPIVLTDVSETPATLQVEVMTPLLSPPPADNVARVSTARYWQITPVEGTWAGAIVELTVNEEDGLDDLLGAIVVAANDEDGEFTSLGQSAAEGDASQGTVTGELPLTQPIVAVGVTREFSVRDQVLVPSAFSPEALDPVNRVLKIYAAALQSEPFLFHIFDRWGNLVYRTLRLEQAREEGWDGRRQSDQSLAEPGVYSYHLQGVLEGNIAVNQTGTITLFR